VTLFLAGMGLILAGGLVARGGRAYQALVVLGCAVALADTVPVLASGVERAASLAAALPGGDWLIGIDRLSAVFLLPVLVVGALCAMFGTRDLAKEAHPHGFTQAAFAVLLVAIALVVTARAVVTFLVAWEVMAISSYLLIVTHREHADVRRAGLIYLIATHTATLALFAMFAIWQSAAGDWSFAALAAAAPVLPAGATAAVLLLALVGFGFKAGCVPLHVWLPPAHAAAPTHVSALMSGIVIKTGIYGLLRVVLMLGGAPAWWGWIVLGIGAASGVLGVLWALAQHDSKRLLAYHSVENIGIILMGIGVGVLAGRALPALAALGFAAALLHTVNHALFKSLLFLGAGAVYRATGTRNLEELGGLHRGMPLVWLTFLVGAAAIVGLPPFNGFVSEWLLFQGLFTVGQSGAAGALRLTLLGIPALGLIGALALACFAKVAGVVFLGTPRSAHAQGVTEDRRATAVPLLALAAACIVLGLVPRLGIGLVHATAVSLAGPAATGLPDSVAAGAQGVAWLVLATIAVVAVLWLIRSALTRRATMRREPTWGCGFDTATPRMQYTASSFATPLLSMFGFLAGVRTERAAAGPPSLRTEPTDLVLDDVALPLWHRLRRAALRLRPMQQGRLHLYLLYVFAAVLVLLGYLTFGPGR
jgi:hydrogenase-4 component B